jgi:hypothetical protein
MTEGEVYDSFLCRKNCSSEHSNGMSRSFGSEMQCRPCQQWQSPVVFTVNIASAIEMKTARWFVEVVRTSSSFLLRHRRLFLHQSNNTAQTLHVRVRASYLWEIEVEKRSGTKISDGKYLTIFEWAESEGRVASPTFIKGPVDGSFHQTQWPIGRD